MEKKGNTANLIVETRDSIEQFTAEGTILRADSPFLETRGRFRGRVGTLSETVEFAGRILRRQFRKARS